MGLKNFIGMTFLICFKLYAGGAWYQKPEQVSQLDQKSFYPEFAILKMGVFSSQGHLTPNQQVTPTALKTYCSSKHPETLAWVTHRLNPKETLSENAGKNLGTQLTQLLSGTCIASVELDIEPLVGAEGWLEVFLKAVKSNLSKDIKLRMAVPVLAPHSVPGHFWTLRDGAQVIQWVDGLDVMVYDSGVKSSKEYSELFKNTFFFVMELPKQSPGKDIIVGLPVYQDKTSFHDKQIENLETVLETLKPFTPFQMKPFCKGEIRFAYYAGWTLTQKDLEVHQKLKEWKNEICKKS